MSNYEQTMMIETNKVYNTECLEGMKLIQDETIDLVVTDPPYYIENLKADLKEQTIRGSSRNSIFCESWDSQWTSVDDFKAWMQKLLLELRRVLKPKAQVYMFMSYHHLDWCIKMIKELDFRFYKPLIWYKPDIMGVFPNQYGCNYEVILWFRKRGEGGRHKNHIGCSQRDVFVYNSTINSYRKECGYHPTCKPIDLVRRLVANGSDEGDLVLDPFMGSGTTAVACKQKGRRYLGFELDTEYFKTIEERLKQTTLSDNLLAFTEHKEELSIVAIPEEW